MRRISSSSSSSEKPLEFKDTDDDVDAEEDDDLNTVCNGYFYDKRGPKCDWIDCIVWKKWLHNNCNKDGAKFPKCRG